jgi:Zn-dependent oligopeptidase
MGKRILLSGNCRTKWRKPRESNELLAKIAGPAVAKAKVEAKEIQDLIDGQNGGFKLEPWIEFLFRTSS